MGNEIPQQLEQIRNGWDQLSIVPDDLAGWGFPGLTKQAISDSIGSLVEISREIEAAEGGTFDSNLAARYAAVQLESQLRAYVTQHIPSNPQPHIAGFLTILENLRLSVLSHLRESDTKKQRIATALATRLADGLTQVNTAEAVYAKSIAHAKEAEELEKAISLNAKTAEALAAEITERHSNAVADAEIVSSLQATAKEEAAEITTSVAMLEKLKAELEEAKATQHYLFGEFESYRVKVEAILADSNRTGMASSFITRKTELNADRALWRNVFGGSLLILTLLGVFYFAPLAEKHDFEQWLLRLPLTAPIVWLAWFSAKQYGYATRLREDYAYKVASSMAFEGYKREVGNFDKDMKGRLLETAISNFGDNPLRIFNGHENHASPMQEALEKLLKDEGISGPLKAAISRLLAKVGL